MVGVAFICCTFVAKIKCHLLFEYFIHSKMISNIVLILMDKRWMFFNHGGTFHENVEPLCL